MSKPQAATASPNDPAVSAAVSASAGTGKTYLLITRLVRLLLAGARPEGILALTFTRKAAAEMRERLNNRLQELALADEPGLTRALQQIGVEADPALCRRARTLYETVLFADRKPRITTFHAFCQEILRRFPLEADIPAGYELLETTGLVEETAWDALCLQATRAPDAEPGKALETLFVECNGLANTYDALVRGFLQHRSDWWAYTEDRPDPAGWATDNLRRWLQPPSEPLARFFAEQHSRLLADYAHLLNQHPTRDNLKRAAAIDQALATAYSLEKRFEAVQSAFLTQAGEPRKIKASKTLEQKLGAAGQDRYLALTDQLTAAVLETREQCRRAAAFKVNTAWYRAGQALLDHYQTIKQEQRLLDFADLEWQTYRLLHDADQALWVQYKLDQKIDHLLLDEFQDTNPTQWQLLIPLLEEIAAGEDPERPRSVFLVGDTKQSIYGFRRANPRLQHTASNWLVERLDAQTFPLSRSRRSAPAVMELVNAVFLDTPVGDQLGVFTEHHTHREDQWGCARLLPAVVADDNDDTATDEEGLRDPLTRGRSESEVSAHYREGRLIAEHIQTLLDNPPPVEEGGRRRPLTGDDIFILIRNRTHAAQYERALLDAGIAFIGAEKGSLLESLEVQDIEALLGVLMTPFDNLALARVLRSPLFSAGDDDLIRLADLGGANWYQRLTDPGNEPGLSPALRRAARLLPRWHRLTGRLPVHDLIDRIYYEGDVIDRFRRSTPTLLQGRVTANLQQVLDMALQVDSGRYPSLMRFLDRLKRIRRSADEAPDNPPDPGPSAKVRLMTIHAAKGLEAPVVFLADTAASVKRNDSYRALVDWPAARPRPEQFVLYTRADACPEPIAGLRETVHRMQTAEDANLLYVALTRARHMVVISAAANNDRALEKGWYALLKQGFERLAGSRDDGGDRIGAVPAPDPHQPAPEPDDTGADEAPPPFDGGPPPAGGAEAEDAARPAVTDDPEARQYGIVVHHMLERLSPPGAVSGADAERHLPEPVGGPMLAACRREAEAVLGEPRFAFLFEPARYRAAYKEVPIACGGAGGDMQYGIVDRLVVTDDAVWVIDYKTRRSPDGAGGDAALERDREQLNRYTAAVARLWPDRPVRRGVLFTRDRELVEL